MCFAKAAFLFSCAQIKIVTLAWSESKCEFGERSIWRLLDFSFVLLNVVDFYKGFHLGMPSWLHVQHKWHVQWKNNETTKSDICKTHWRWCHSEITRKDLCGWARHHPVLQKPAWRSFGVECPWLLSKILSVSPPSTQQWQKQSLAAFDSAWGMQHQQLLCSNTVVESTAKQQPVGESMFLWFTGSTVNAMTVSWLFAWLHSPSEQHCQHLRHFR